MPIILDGKKIAAEIRGEVKEKVARMGEEKGIVPGLAFITVGEDPASLTYVKMKEKACAEVGIRSWQLSLPGSLEEEELLETIAGLNEKKEMHGILVQLPLPSDIDEYRIISAIAPGKDVDGFHPVNMGKLLLGRGELCPCTPMGIVELLVRSGGTWAGKDVVIVGRSNIVGKPLAALLMQRGERGNATVTVCHTRTRDLAEHTRSADIVVVAIGRPLFLKADMVSDGVTVIDVGVNRVEDKTAKRGYRLVGDVDYDGVAPGAEFISPVPGGVGPMTIAMLLSNTLKVARAQAG